MSDEFNHEMDAWDQAIFHPDYVNEGDADRYRKERGQSKRPWELNPPPRISYRQPNYHSSGWNNGKDYINHLARSMAYELNKRADQEQPEYQQLIVRCVHRQTEKSYNVTGEIKFDPPFHGLTSFQYLADWIPKSQCIITGNKVRIPHWLVRKRIEARLERDVKFEGLFRQYEAKQQEREDILHDIPF